MNNYNQRMDHGNEAYYSGRHEGPDDMYDRDRGRRENRPWNEERDRNWNIRGDRGREEDDRNIFQRMGDRIRDTWNEWTGHDDDDRMRDDDRRIYPRGDYRTSGQRGGYIPEGPRGSRLHNSSDYDYGTGNYGAQGMSSNAYDRDFTYSRRGQNAGSANISGSYFYDRSNEPSFNRARHPEQYDNRYGSRGNDRYSRDSYGESYDDRYRRDDRSPYGERNYFGNDAYGAGRIGGYDDHFPEDYRYDQWRRGTR